MNGFVLDSKLELGGAYVSGRRDISAVSAVEASARGHSCQVGFWAK